ncbi:MAG: hypothetical protein FWD66_03680 [Paludibacter sp.]|nr:hypothetical protein [Paludibacter sp.]
MSNLALIGSSKIRLTPAESNQIRGGVDKKTKNDNNDTVLGGSGCACCLCAMGQGGAGDATARLQS